MNSINLSGFVDVDYSTPAFKSLEELPVRHPQVYEQVKKGHFTSEKSDRKFSAMSEDQLDEQNNMVIKGDGGAVGILNNETVLLKWMVGGPEVARMIKEFECQVVRASDPPKQTLVTTKEVNRFKFVFFNT